MDLLLLFAQVLLVVLLVVIPLFSGYDKWRAWSPTRKVVGVALAMGIAVVAFSQYRRVVSLHDDGLERAVGNVGLFHGPWYARRVSVSLWEWVGSVIAGALLLAVAVDALRRREWLRGLALGGLFALMLGLGVLLKLRGWSS